MSKELLLKAASELEARDARISELEGQLKTASDERLVLAKEVSQRKTASETATAELAGLAKHASELLFNAGIIQTKEASEKLSTDILDHTRAINALGNLASRVGQPKAASVVVGGAPGSNEPATADAAWDARCRNQLAKMGG